MQKPFLILPALLLAAVVVFEFVTAPAEDSSTPVIRDGLVFATPHPNPRGRVSDKFPDSMLIDHAGRKHRFYEDLVRDKIVVVQFMYTTCTGI